MSPLYSLPFSFGWIQMEKKKKGLGKCQTIDEEAWIPESSCGGKLYTNQEGILKVGKK